MKQTPTKQLSTTQRVKNLLLTGRKLTVAQMHDLFKVNNAPEIISRVRKLIPVTTEWKQNRETGKRYGVYSHPKEEKKNRITTGEYRNFSESKRYSVV